MRKILLATTALIALSGAAQAANSSPINVNVGGTVDFMAGNFAASNRGSTTSTASANRDFETVYDLMFNIKGKSNSGVEYGGVLGLSNAPDISNAFQGTTNTYLNAGNIWMSGAFGKVVLGDSHGATDLAVTAPTVGEGQVTGNFIDFLNSTTFAKNFATGIDGTDHSTNVTYFTPKVGNEANKVQLGVSYIPQFYNYGSSSVQYEGGADSHGNGGSTLSPYHDVVKGALAYTGKIAPVAIDASAQILTGSADYTSAGTDSGDTWIWNAPAGGVQNFTAWGFGAQGAVDGFTFGATYLDQGHYNTVVGQNKDQDQFTAAVKYEFNKAAVGVSYMGAEGYANMLTTTPGATVATTNYVKDYNAYGVGGAYTWAPGLTSNLDGVFFDQKSDSGLENDGYVLLVSQKLAF